MQTADLNIHTMATRAAALRDASGPFILARDNELLTPMRLVAFGDMIEDRRCENPRLITTRAGAELIAGVWNVRMPAMPVSVLGIHEWCERLTDASDQNFSFDDDDVVRTIQPDDFVGEYVDVMDLEYA